MPEIPEFYFNSLPDGGEFHTAAGLLRKVGEDGRLLPFRGETTVFLLGEDAKEALALLQDRIYSAAGEMLCRDRLSREHFHLTLHDLWNEAAEARSPGYSRVQVKAVLESIRRDFEKPIRLRAISLLSMVCTSVVLALVPAGDEDEAALNEMYERLQEIWPLGYGLTPHITLAYYRPGVYPQELWSRLGAAFAIEEFELVISAEHLIFQRFEDMDSYREI